MKVIDPGHSYELASLDGECRQTLTFVKREGPGYPGNVGSHPGTTMQDVLRALIERAEYVNNQIPCIETERAIEHMAAAVWLFESRAARRHGREPPTEAVHGAVCTKCGHVGCEGESCRRQKQKQK